MRIVKAINVSVLRSAYGDCTNGGVSSKSDVIPMICSKGYIDIDLDNAPDNLVVLRNNKFAGKDHFCIEPYKKVSNGCVGWMAGGNFAHSCDSRFSEMINGMTCAVSIHDRQETVEQYATYD